MGYTHYFQLTGKPTSAQFSSFVSNAHKIAFANNIKLSCKFESDLVVINGVGEGEHEDFYISSRDYSWNFCKTAQKPYDEVVTAVLILARYIFDSKFTVSSDGSWGEWRKGRELFTKVMCLEPAEATVFGNQEEKASA